MEKKKRIVIALGGNALGNTLPEQMAAVKITARAIVDLIQEGCEVGTLPTFISNKITMVGLIPGRVTYLILFHLPAPSMAAASYREGSMDVMAAR